MSESNQARQLLDTQRAAFTAEGFAGVKTRRHRLERAIDLLVTHQQAICEAHSADFGQRSQTLTRFVDILPALSSLKHARRSVERWMRPRRKRIGLPAGAPGVRAEIIHQPLGIIGVISPWNFPITLTFGPLAGILAAGNRCLIKPSELTPTVSALLQRLISEYFETVGGRRGDRRRGGRRGVLTAALRPSGVHGIHAGGQAGDGRGGRESRARDSRARRQVSGARGSIGRPRAGRGSNHDRQAQQRWTGLHCPGLRLRAARALRALRRPRPLLGGARLSGVPSSPDYTSMISERHAQRMHEMLADAASKGAIVVPLGDAGESEDAGRAVRPALLLEVTDQMRVMREEIFGPLLVVRPYDRIEDAVLDINARPKPLALYYFGANRREMSWVLANTASGGVTVNDIAVHFLADELPFGGVGGERHGRLSRRDRLRALQPCAGGVPSDLVGCGRPGGIEAPLRASRPERAQVFDSR